MRESDSFWFFDGVFIPLEALSRVYNDGAFGVVLFAVFIGLVSSLCVTGKLKMGRSLVGGSTLVLSAVVFLAVFFHTFADIEKNQSGKTIMQEHYSLKSEIRYYEKEIQKWKETIGESRYIEDTDEGAEFIGNYEITLKVSEDFKEMIIVKYTNRFNLFFFIFLSFILFLPETRFYLINCFNGVKKSNRERKEKIIDEKNQIEFTKKQEDLRLRKLEEKRLNIELEKERTKQMEASASVQLKKLDVERPEKEENLAKILNKIDDL